MFNALKKLISTNYGVDPEKIETISDLIDYLEEY